jgi:hypothetical protein
MKQSLTHEEAQELHLAIGAAIELGDLSGLERARELAAIIVADTSDEDTPRCPVCGEEGYETSEECEYCKDNKLGFYWKDRAVE